ncbi:MAG: hypothetical protein AAFZ18_05515 [Myxococcota bacterium]
MRSNGAEDSALVVLPTTAVVPVASRRSLFATYQRREGVLVNVVAVGVFLGALTSAAASSVAFGPLWGLGFLGVGLASVRWIADAWGLFGNEELASRLREKLDVEGEGWTFVGVCRGDQNRLAAKLLPPRIDTDENVGFLKLDREHLELRLEDVTVRIPRTDVRDVRTEEVVEAPCLRWIRLELFDADGQVTSFLLMSREAETLRDQQSENERLFEAIRDWHVEDKLAPLVAAGELPALLLEPA